ncbi:MAG: 5'-nucleotidase C-terminal domain-containing protein, partial [Bryobacteraceae bacterium]|nr:5'-nucleotidase C-terminal domain-containing protein [Bryobacteraceae bacterium]
YTFLDAKAALIKTVAELRSLEKPDLTLVLAHTGLDRDAQSGALRLGDLRGENVTWQLATQVPGIDAVIFGHTHAQVNELRANGVLLTQPKNWGMSLARLDFFLESSAGGQGWRVKSKSSRVIPVTPQVAADAAVLNLARPYHEVTERYLDSPVAQATSTIDASVSRIEDTPIIDAIQAVQLHYAQADVSFTSSFNPRARIPQGSVTVRQIAGLYIYDNELYAIQGTGLMVRKALENAARYFSTCPDSECRVPSLINRDFIGFNYDVAQGVTYSIDLTKPVGQRIVDLRFKGALLEDARKLRIAVNNYRAGGSGGYDMFKGAPVVWRSYDDIRQLIIQYYSSHGLPSTADGNWRIIPEPAHRKLAQEARALAGRSMTQ